MTQTVGQEVYAPAMIEPEKRYWTHAVALVRSGLDYEVECEDCPWGVMATGDGNALRAQARHADVERDADGKPRPKPRAKRAPESVLTARREREERRKAEAVRQAIETLRLYAPERLSPAGPVREFHERFGYPAHDTPTVPSDGLADLRKRLLRSEVEEAEQAIDAADLAGLAGELADVVYVAYGTAVTYGLPLDAAIAEVHRANMTKDVGTTGKAVKGEQFVPADLDGVLRRCAP